MSWRRRGVDTAAMHSEVASGPQSRFEAASPRTFEVALEARLAGGEVRAAALGTIEIVGRRPRSVAPGGGEDRHRRLHGDLRAARRPARRAARQPAVRRRTPAGSASSATTARAPRGFARIEAAIARRRALRPLRFRPPARLLPQLRARARHGAGARRGSWRSATRTTAGIRTSSQRFATRSATPSSLTATSGS